MRKIFIILITGLLVFIPAIKALDLTSETNDLISRIDAEASNLNTTLIEFNNYLNSNTEKVASALDIESLKEISEYLIFDDYNNALSLFENKVNDTNLTNLNIATKINSYLTLKRDIIKFVEDNKTELNLINGSSAECSLELFHKIKTSFNLIKPTISNTIEYLGKIFSKNIETNLNEKKNIQSNKFNLLIDEYKELASSISNLTKKYNNSLDEYENVFKIIADDEDLFELAFRKKFRDDFNKLINDIDTLLKTPINEFIDRRWEILEENVTETVESDKTETEKNEIIYAKIDQVNDINDKFVSAINEVIGDLDINSIKEKMNSILERGDTEFSNAVKYLEDHLIIGDYDIELITNHDNKITIDRAQELIILDKLFEIEEFKNQIELINNFGTLVFNTGSYNKVPNKASIIVTDNGETQKEYKVIVKGDINGNGAITVTDVVMAAYYSLESIDLDQEEGMAADVNSNGAVTVTDVYMIAMRALEGDE